MHLDQVKWVQQIWNSYTCACAHTNAGEMSATDLEPLHTCMCTHKRRWNECNRSGTLTHVHVHTQTQVKWVQQIWNPYTRACADVHTQTNMQSRVYIDYCLRPDNKWNKYCSKTNLQTLNCNHYTRCSLKYFT